MRGWIIAGAGAVVVCAAIVLSPADFVGPAPDSAPARTVGSASHNGPAFDAALGPAVDDDRDPPTAADVVPSGHGVVAVAEPDGADPSDADDHGSSVTRVRTLRATLRRELDAIEGGEDPTASGRRAEAALSALRGELYASEAGRREHQRREAQLDAALQDAQERVGQ